MQVITLLNKKKFFVVVLLISFLMYILTPSFYEDDYVKFYDFVQLVVIILEFLLLFAVKRQTDVDRILVYLLFLNVLVYFLLGVKQTNSDLIENQYCFRILAILKQPCTAILTSKFISIINSWQVVASLVLFLAIRGFRFYKKEDTAHK
jgi:hypothetical protein